MTDPTDNPPGHDIPKRRRNSGGITLRDVARLAGVAPITASRALNNPSVVSDAIMQRVKDAVAQTGYVPNMLAGGLASRKSRLVAAVIPTIAGNVFLEMVQSLTAALAQHGYQVMLGQSGYEDSREDELLEAIIGRRPDGVVLTGIMHSSAGRKRLLNSGIPVVETWDLAPNPIDMLIGFSHEKVGQAVAEYLHARGRRRVATLGADDDRAQRRMRSFSETAIALGMAAPGETAIPALVAPSVATRRRPRACKYSATACPTFSCEKPISMSIGLGARSQVSTTGMPLLSRRLRPADECMIPVRTTPSGRRPMMASSSSSSRESS